MTVAKGIAKGFPLSAIVALEELMEQWTTGSHGGTYGGNPVACAASLAVTELLQGRFLDYAVYMVEQLNSLKRHIPRIKDIRGLGLMVGMEFMKEDGTVDAQSAQLVKQIALEKGLILLTCGSCCPNHQGIFVTNIIAIL